MQPVKLTRSIAVSNNRLAAVHSRKQLEFTDYKTFAVSVLTAEILLRGFEATKIR